MNAGDGVEARKASKGVPMRDHDDASAGRGGLDRRQFLAKASVAGAGLVVGTAFGGRPAFAVGPRATPPSSVQTEFDTLINPKPGSLLRNPRELPLRRTGNVAAGELTARRSPVQIDNGPTAELATYNGEYPGPLIRVRSGEILDLRLTNGLPADGVNVHGHQRGPTNLHTHGWHVSPRGNADNVFVEIEPGATFDYRYDLSRHRPGTLNWYHPHHHGLVAEQLWAGLAGAMIVEDGDIAPSLAPYRAPGKEYVCVLKDIEIVAGRPAPHGVEDFQLGKEGSTVTINGQVNPVLPMRPGEVKRLRFVNTSTARYYTLSLEGHGDEAALDGFHLIGTDGGLLESSVRVDTPNPSVKDRDGVEFTNKPLSPFITVAPGERVDMLVKATATSGTYRLLSLPYDRGQGKRELVVLMTLEVAGAPVDDRVPGRVNLRPDVIPAAVRENLDALPRRELDLSMAMDTVDGSLDMFINGIKWHGAYPTERSHKIRSRVAPDSYEVWRVVDSSTMDHPFHIHTDDFQILKIVCGNGEQDYATFYESPGMQGAWKDTLNVGKGDMEFEILVPVTDFGGDTVFHCHIVEHEDSGMIGRWIREGGT